MGFHLLIACAGVFASWAVLSVIGSERQRKLDAMEIERRSAEAKAEQERLLAAAREKLVPIAPAARQSGR